MSKNTRTNSNGVDLNRNFPTKTGGRTKEITQLAMMKKLPIIMAYKSPASEIETRFVIDVIEKYSPSMILTLHTPYKVVEITMVLQKRNC